MQRYFITGSGTAVGKTFTTAAIASQLSAIPANVTCLKPIVSGMAASDANPDSDPAILLAACGKNPTLENINAISPWRFPAPLSPDIAAAMAGAEINFDEVVAFCRSHENKKNDFLLIEGAGGIMTPISATATMLDLAAALEYPLIIVAGNYLGSISHTLSAIAAAKTRNLAIAAIIVSESSNECIINEIATSIGNHAAENILILPAAPSWRQAEPIIAGLSDGNSTTRTSGRK